MNAGDELGVVPTQAYGGKEVRNPKHRLIHPPPNMRQRDVEFYHYGYLQAYLSRAPADLESYTGDGDWFKIASLTAKNDTQWVIYGDTMVCGASPGYLLSGRADDAPGKFYGSEDDPAGEISASYGDDLWNRA